MTALSDYQLAIDALERLRDQCVNDEDNELIDSVIALIERNRDEEHGNTE